MAIERMKLYHVSGAIAQFDDALRACCSTGCFQLEPATSVLRTTEGYHPVDDVNPWEAPLTRVVELCNAAGVPTYCCSATTVQSGCLATLAMSDVAIGEQTAAIAAQVLSGTPVEDIPAVVVPAEFVSVNEDTMNALGLTIPDEVVEAYGDVQYLTNG